MSAATTNDRQARAADTGMWLFIASLVMFFGSLFSGYVLLRTGSSEWTTPWRGMRQPWELSSIPWAETVKLAAVAAAVHRYRTSAGPNTFAPHRVWWLWLAATFGASHASRWWTAAEALAASGRGPATSVAAGSWYVLTGIVAVLVAGGALATVWQIWRHGRGLDSPLVPRQLERYWWLMLAFQLAVVVGMSLI
jgi:heme/copper-type cytochrome/quinol oxidase subunit 3